MRISQSDDLLRIGRVSENFLITGHRGIEDHFAHGFTRGANGKASKDAAIFQYKNGGNRQRNLLADRDSWEISSGGSRISIRVRKKARWIAPSRFFWKFL